MSLYERTDSEPLPGKETAYWRTLSVILLREAKATDRICTKHDNREHVGATSCEGDGSFQSWQDCVMVDVVRLDGV